jgi:outer membrane lipoprotein SlyB
MIAKWVRISFLPLLLIAGLAACDSGAVQPGVVRTSGTAAYTGETGRVVSIQEARIRGGSQSGVSNGTLVGGGAGLLGGAILGGSISRSAGGALLGGLLGAVGGAIAGTAIDRNGGAGRGIEVTVQKDDGQNVVIAQRDDGDVQLGDRVQIVTDRSGVAKAVRDNSRAPDQTGNRYNGQYNANYQPNSGYQNNNYQPNSGYYQPNSGYQNYNNYQPNSNYQGNYQPANNYQTNYNDQNN